MNNTYIKNSDFNSWNEYSDFEFIWLETMLNRTMRKNDIVDIFKKFGIEFTEKKYLETVKQEEMGNIIINDIKRGELLPLIKQAVKEKYSYLLSFKECEEIYKDLLKKDKSVLIRFYVDISQNENLKILMKEKRFAKENTKKDLIGFIIDELYKISKEEAIKKLKNSEEGDNGNKTGRKKGNS